jgi:hypothetical protein
MLMKYVDQKFSYVDNCACIYIYSCTKTNYPFLVVYFLLNLPLI